MTISGPAVPVFCMYVVAAERQGVDTGKLNGTLQTDIFKEYIAQKEWLFPPEPHLRLIGDLMEYCAAEIPAYKPLSVSGYHIREAGSTAAQELAFTLADGFGYVELGQSRGLDVDLFAPGLSFFFDAHIDFFEEIAKFRAARRIWARWMRDVYGAKTDKAQWLRFHTQTAGVSLTAQQPDNNIVRTAIEALAAVLGGTNSLHTNALDEVLALPSDKAAEIALRTQQVIAEETGVANVADPLGGSWYVEALTDRIEAEAEKIFAADQGPRPRRHDDLGPAARHRGRLVHRRDRRGRVRYQRALEKGDKRVVGVNTLTGSIERRWRSCGSRTRSSSPRTRARRPPAARDQAARAPPLADVEARAPSAQHDPADARRRPGRGHAGRDLRRSRRVGRRTPSLRASDPRRNGQSNPSVTSSLDDQHPKIRWGSSCGGWQRCWSRARSWWRVSPLPRWRPPRALDRRDHPASATSCRRASPGRSTRCRPRRSPRATRRTGWPSTAGTPHRTSRTSSRCTTRSTTPTSGSWPTASSRRSTRTRR